MIRHTDGPWTPVETASEKYMAHVYAGNKQGAQTIALVGAVNVDEANANAALIAAAPELLEALQELMTFWDNGTPVQPGALVVDQAKQAIAAATGEGE